MIAGRTVPRETLMMFRWTAALAAAVLTLLAACGGGADHTKAQVRLVNASSGYAQLSMRVDDELRQGPVAYGESASYVEVNPGKVMTLQSGGSSTSLLSFTPSVSVKRYYTVLAYGPLGKLKQLSLDDNLGAPDTNRALLRVVNGAPDAGALDIYLTASNDTLDAAVPQLSGVAADAVSDTITVNSGTWRLRVTAANSKTDLRLDVPALTLSSKQVATLVLSPAVGGVLVKGLLLTQQGEITAQAPTQARLRVAAGLSDTSRVSVRLGGAPVLSNITSPAVTQYVLVNAGTQTLGVDIGGTSLGSSTYPLVAGAEYTLLVYGTPAAAQPIWIVDDNNLPTDRTQARVRLVNGVEGLAGTVSLSVDFTPMADNVAAGLASSYAALAATTTAQISVTVAGVDTPLFSAIDQPFAAASNNTVFVLGSASNAKGFLRKDR
jgi:hypothetical protein